MLPTAADDVRTRSTHGRTAVLPGLLFAAAATAVSFGVHWTVGQLSTLIVAVVIGMAVGNGPANVDVLRPGLAIVARQLLRFGIVLLGLRLSVTQIGELGVPVVVLVVVTVVATFFGTRALGRRLGVSPALSLLIATGYSICGASAIAAMEPTAGAEDEEVAMAIGLVTVAGTVAMFGLPVLSTLLGLTDAQFGTWVGASTHDVAQVVAAASTGGSAVLGIAIVVKLTRVVLLAPLVALVSMRRAHNADDATTGAATPVLPAFVLGFLILMAVRSTGVVPRAAVDMTTTVSGLALTAALVGLGAGVRIDRIRSLGGAPVVLASCASVLIATVSLLATLVLV